MLQTSRRAKRVTFEPSAYLRRIVPWHRPVNQPVFQKSVRKSAHKSDGTELRYKLKPLRYV